MAEAHLAKWHAYVDSGDAEILRGLLADDVVFHSPVVHTPQRGKGITFLYLSSATQVLGNDGFTYLREVSEGDHSILEFQTEIDGIQINGVDMITWNEAGQIIDFKVMVRPLKAVNMLHAKMGEMLERQKARTQ